MRRRRLLAVTLASAILVAGALVDHATALSTERAETASELLAATARADAAVGRSLHLQDAVARAEKEVSERAAVLEVRPGFLVEIEALAAALDQADGKVDTSSHLASAVSAQDTVLAERRDPAVVTAATATVQALTTQVEQQVTGWRAAQVSPASTPGPGGGTEGFARVRAALDRVGGAGVGLYESSSCAGGNAPACANSDGYIKYRADIAGWSDGRLHWAMAHELAHIHQFRVWGALTSSAAYQSMFGGDPEFLANCMAVVRGFPGDVGCSAEQQAWASGIWVGAVR
ncbi:hypothetical protein [Microbacterium sp. 179-I 3D4 NHS]|uniref:hypothetical protein n=1 Tax=Microbacterium sp. 179-I 3D4 NHS TaxID=3142381 RepID=UPI0039A222BA